MEIGPAEARSIFLDWMLGLPEGDPRAEIERLLARYGTSAPDHPMTAVLREGVLREGVLREGLAPPRPGRRRRRPA